MKAPKQQSNRNEPPKEHVPNFNRKRFQWHAVVCADNRLTATALRVAGKLFHEYLNGEHGGNAWPAIETLAEAIGASVRSTQEALSQLVSFGHLATEPRPKFTTLYRMAVIADRKIIAAPQKADSKAMAKSQTNRRVASDKPREVSHPSNPAKLRTPRTCLTPQASAPSNPAVPRNLTPRSFAPESNLGTHTNLSLLPTVEVKGHTREPEAPPGCMKVGWKFRQRREAAKAAALAETVQAAEPIAGNGSPEVSPPIAAQPASLGEPQGSARLEEVVDAAFVDVQEVAASEEPGPSATACEADPKPAAPVKPTKAKRQTKNAATEAEAFAILRECLSAGTARDVIEHRNAKKKPLKTARAARELAKAFVDSGNPEKAAAKLIQMDWTGYNPNWADCKFEPDIPPIEEAMIRAALCGTVGDKTADAILAHLIAKGARITTSLQAEKLAKAFVASGDAERAAAKMLERGWKSFDPTWPGCNFTQPQGPARQLYGGAPASSLDRFNATSAKIDRQMDEYAKRHAPEF
jgi:hypothetical protein